MVCTKSVNYVFNIAIEKSLNRVLSNIHSRVSMMRKMGFQNIRTTQMKNMPIKALKV